jgi:hypothetical protein
MSLSPSKSHALGLRYFALAALAWLLVRASQLLLLGWGTGNDVYLYLHYAQQWGSGAAPYVDFHPEYPPGALPPFLLPFLIAGGGGEEYPRAFAGEMALFDLATLWLVLAWGRRLFPSHARAPALAAVGYLACTTALFPVLYTRFDLVPGALLFAALYVTYTPGLAVLGALLLGVAGGVKLWPFALAPIWLVLAYRRDRLRGLLPTALAIGVGGLLTALPFLPRAGLSVLEFLRFHAARGIQIESTWSTLALLLNAVGIADATPVHEFGAFHVAGAVAKWFARISVPALLALALLPQLLAMRGQLGREGDQTGKIGLCAAAGAVLGFMVGGKVLSPQFMLWIVPFLPMLAFTARTRTTQVLVALGALFASGLTSLVYPYWSPALEQREPGHGAALLAVGTRNMLLLALYAFAAHRAARRETQAPSGKLATSPIESATPERSDAALV